MATRPAPATRSLLLRTGGGLLGLGVAFVGAVLVRAGTTGTGAPLIALGLLLAASLVLGADRPGRAALRSRLSGGARQLRPWTALLALWLLLKIPVPLWPAGFSVLATLSTLCLFLAALAYLWARAGAGRALASAALAFALGLAVEVAGSRTGLPFGVYSYAGAPGPLLLGVPLLVPLGWFGMTLSAALLSGGRPWLSGLLLLGWDLGLEPLMTGEGFWRWNDPGGVWSGAPLVNFLGWYAVGVAISFAFTLVAPDLFAGGRARWSPLRAAPFAAAYLLETLFLPAGLLLLGRGGAGLVCLAGMGAAAAIALAVPPGVRAWAGPRSS